MGANNLISMEFVSPNRPQYQKPGIQREKTPLKFKGEVLMNLDDRELEEIRKELLTSMRATLGLFHLNSDEKKRIKTLEKKFEQLPLERIQHIQADLIQMTTTTLLAWSELRDIRRAQHHHPDGEDYRLYDVIGIKDAVYETIFKRLEPVIQKTRSTKPRAKIISFPVREH